MADLIEPLTREPSARMRPYLRTCRALGLRHRVMDPDETPTRVTVWSVREVAAVQARVGGAVAVSPAVGDPQAVMVTLTVNLPDIGAVDVSTVALNDYPDDVATLAGMLAMDGGAR
ncbi:hypothetical protein [Streptomyces sp. SBT349]|uniref:hypothetical protein n=1 Tax=Streptomyces sp. SBT349 TaxID=1580539 RepID=UPI00066ACD47|nr:hypothetical protein [Streptomyces sp. SBT349]